METRLIIVEEDHLQINVDKKSTNARHWRGHESLNVVLLLRHIKLYLNESTVIS